jgi:hypothetical protein
MGEKPMVDFNPVPLPLSLQAELAKRRSHRIKSARQRPVPKELEGAQDPNTKTPASEDKALNRRQKALIANLEAQR